MLNFTVGPVQANDEVRAIGAEQVPYFRTAEFSEVMLENERILLKLAGAPEGSRAVFLTGSGTAGMEATIMNTLDGDDRVLVVDGGSFGHRFVELLQLHAIPHTIISPEMGFGIDETAVYGIVRADRIACSAFGAFVSKVADLLFSGQGFRVCTPGASELTAL